MASGTPRASGAVPWDELKKELGFTEEEAARIRRQADALLAQADVLRRMAREAVSGEEGPLSG
ncbi:hypothetical protein [Streptomyces sp. SID11385]|uniref:hypothetical protein n=1 Tax=Streptomyces sp. SID11385 TaxID=2706031 RepID=UPI0013C76B39|nr:hypothetical protein [Streptomyces sp. SID11385]NEA43433.1 hypothetical protein [Streptomyces sp. SID11385]